MKPESKAPSFHQVTSRGVIGDPGEELLSRFRLNAKQTDPKSQHPVPYRWQGERLPGGALISKTISKPVKLIVACRATYRALEKMEEPDHFKVRQIVQR